MMSRWSGNLASPPVRALPVTMMLLMKCDGEMCDSSGEIRLDAHVVIIYSVFENVIKGKVCWASLNREGELHEVCQERERERERESKLRKATKPSKYYRR